MSFLLEPIVKDTVLKAIEEVNPFEIARKESERVIGDAVENTLHEVPGLSNLIDEKNELVGKATDEIETAKKKVFDETGITRIEDHLNKNIKGKVSKFKKKLGIGRGEEDLGDEELKEGTNRALKRIGYDATDPQSERLNTALSKKNVKLQRISSQIERIEQFVKEGSLDDENAINSLKALFKQKEDILDGKGAEDGKPYHETEFQQEKDFYDNILMRTKGHDPRILKTLTSEEPFIGKSNRNFEESIRRHAIKDRINKAISDTINTDIESFDEPSKRLTSEERNKMSLLFDKPTGESFKIAGDGSIKYNIPKGFGRDEIERAIKRGQKLQEIIEKSDNITPELKKQLIGDGITAKKGAGGRTFRDTGAGQEEAADYTRIRKQIRSTMSKDILGNDIDPEFRRARANKRFGLTQRPKIFDKFTPQPKVESPGAGLGSTLQEEGLEDITDEPELPLIPRPKLKAPPKAPKAPELPKETKLLRKKKTLPIPDFDPVIDDPSTTVTEAEPEPEQEPEPEDPGKGKEKEGGEDEPEPEPEPEPEQGPEDTSSIISGIGPATEVTEGSGKVGGVSLAGDAGKFPEGESFDTSTVGGDSSRGPSFESISDDEFSIDDLINEDGSIKSDADIKKSWRDQFPDIPLTKETLNKIKDMIKSGAGSTTGQLALGALGVVLTGLLSAGLAKLSNLINETGALPQDIKDGLTGVIDGIKGTLKDLDKASNKQLNKEIKELGNDILRFGRSSNQRDTQLVTVNNPGTSTTKNKKNRAELDQMETDLKNQRGNISAKAQRLSKDLKAASRKAQRDEIKKEQKEKAKEEKDKQKETAIDRGIVSPRLDPFQFHFNISNDSDNSKLKKTVTPQFTNNVDNSVKVKKTIGNENKLNKSIKGKNNKIVSEGFK